MPEPRIKGCVRGGRGGRGGRGDQTPTLEAVGRQLRNTRQRAAAAAGRGSEPARGRGRGRGRKSNPATRGKGRRSGGVRLESYQSYTEPPPQLTHSSAANLYSQPPNYYPSYDPPQSSSYVPQSPPPPNQYLNSYGSYNSSYGTGADSRVGQSGGGGDGEGGLGGGGYGGYSRVGIGAQDDVFGDGVYQYDGGRSEPYGARGTKSATSWSGIDDYGRSTNFL